MDECMKDFIQTKAYSNVLAMYLSAATIKLLSASNWVRKSEVI